MSNTLKNKILFYYYHYYLIVKNKTNFGKRKNYSTWTQEFPTQHDKAKVVIIAGLGTVDAIASADDVAAVVRRAFDI